MREQTVINVIEARAQLRRRSVPLFIFLAHDSTVSIRKNFSKSVH